MSFSTNRFCRLSLCKDEGEEGENGEEEHHSEADLIHVAGLVSDLETHKLTNKVENSSYSQISDVHNFTSVSFLIPVPVLCSYNQLCHVQLAWLPGKDDSCAV